MKKNRSVLLPGMVVAAVVVWMVFGVSHSQAQKASSFDKDRGRTMLSQIKSDMKKNYYDPAFHGMDLDSRFKTAEEKIDNANSLSHIFGIIAQVLIELGDSHTYFLPPDRASRTEYGFEMQMVGDQCFVSAVKPGSDAEAQGLKVGDELWAIDKIAPTRDTLWKLSYYYNTLRPQPGMMLVIKKPDGKESELPVSAKITLKKRVVDLTSLDGDIFDLIREGENYDRLNRQRYIEVGDELFIWKMPQFDMTGQEVEGMMAKVRNHKALILDLRGNPGGYVKTLESLAGFFFDHDVKIADRKGRKEMKPLMAKTKGGDVYQGKLVVLVDSRSGSAAEIFARLTQLEKRGVVVGDRSAGAVMESRLYSHKSGVDVIAFWALSITDADVIMGDGKSLEKVGVVVDERILPTAADLASKRDPAMVRAAEILGFKLDPEKAGSFFPIEWRK